MTRGIYFSQIKDEDHTYEASKKVLDQIYAFEKQGVEMRYLNLISIGNSVTLSGVTILAQYADIKKT